MPGHVLLQVSLHAERLAADLTRERFLTSVRPQMGFHGSATLADFRTHETTMDLSLSWRLGLFRFLGLWKRKKGNVEIH